MARKNGIRFTALLLALATACMPSQQVATTPPAGPASGDILPLAATEHTLPNGLRVIVVPTGFPNIVSLQIPVQTGSRNEVEPGKSGFAHFFEHMMFRGTDTYPPDVYTQLLTRAGARQNAYTTDDFTNYHTTFAKDDLETMLRIEADRFQNLRYSEDVFRTEARAVLGEYNVSAAEPVRRLVEARRNAAFTTHTYKHTTLGFLRDIEDMPNQYEYSRVFFDRWYRPEYTTLIVAGDVSAAEVLPLVERYWGGWQRGSYHAEIPQEPPPNGPVYAHVPWNTPTPPWVTVSFHGPAFSTTEDDQVAMSMLATLWFDRTSDLYRQLVEVEQKVDQFGAGQSFNVDPELFTISARVRNMNDVVYVRDQILRTVARARTELVDAQRLADAKSNLRYSFIRSLDNTEAIAATLARFVRYNREFETLNELYRLYDQLTPQDLLAAAQRYMTDRGMVVTTLSHGDMPAAMAQLPSLASPTLAGGAPAVTTPAGTTGSATTAPAGGWRVAGRLADVPVVTVTSALPQLNVKLLFRVGSAYDPPGKEGLSALSASMIADAGSRSRDIGEIARLLYPIAGGFSALVDKEMTTFTGVIHRDNWERFADIVLPQLIEPGFRESDFTRLKARQLNGLTVNLRSNNEEELGKERLQQNIFSGTRYAHPVLGTVAGIESITLDDVRDFVRRAYTLENLEIGIAGAAPPEVATDLRAAAAVLPGGPGIQAPPAVTGRRPTGIEVDIIQKDTRATAISFGHPIAVTRAHADYPALYLARTWLGEHRSSMSHLYDRIREKRGMNYGDYAYIEAFPRGMFLTFPDPNIARQAQIFEVWIRPVRPEHAHMALRIAMHEVEQLHRNGLTQQEFEDTRDYLMKNVFVMTATQNQQIGYALDSRWYGIGEFTSYMRERIASLTLDDVNRAVRAHIDPANLSVVIITRDAEALRQALVSDAPSPIVYDAPKPPDILAEDQIIMTRQLGIRPENARVTPVAEVFAR
jgi:zinc protease